MKSSNLRARHGEARQKPLTLVRRANEVADTGIGSLKPTCIHNRFVPWAIFGFLESRRTMDSMGVGGWSPWCLGGDGPRACRATTVDGWDQKSPTIAAGLTRHVRASLGLGPNPWAQFKATNIDQWECPVGQIGLSLGPKGFILKPVPICPCLTWHPIWQGFGGKELGPCQKLGSP